MPEAATVEIRERGTATVKPKTGGRLLIQAIDPGWGSSGYYSPEVLEAAAAARVFPAGLHLYLDHPTTTEETDRPERSVRDLAGALATDAVWTGEALVAEAAVFGPYRDVLAEMKDIIGMSIRGSARITDNGEAEGRRGRIVEELISAASVDFVTHAGRGGKVLEVLESARAAVTERAIAHGVDEATVNNTRDQLQALLKDAYGGEKSWVWVKDFDDNHVWYEVETPDSTDVYQLDYTTTDSGAVTLAGNPVQVRQQTQFVPVSTGNTTESTEEPMADTPTPDPAAQATTPPESAPAAEAAAPTTSDTPSAATEAHQATESTALSSEENSMTENAGAGGTAPPAGSPRQVLEARLQAQSQQIAQLVAKDRARDIIGEELAEAWVADSTKARLSSDLIGNLPLAADLTLDESALRTRCVEARDRAETEAAETLNAAGVGTPRGLGAMRTPAGGDTGKTEEALKEAFAAFGLSDAEITHAVKGR